MSVRFDRGGENGFGGRPLAAEDHQRRKWQRASNRAAAVGSEGWCEASSCLGADGPCRGSELCPDLFTH